MELKNTFDLSSFDLLDNEQFDYFFEEQRKSQGGAV